MFSKEAVRVLPFPENDFLSLLTIGSCALLCYITVLGIYRLYFGPLAGFPGPKIPALTSWYAYYYDVILGGKYVFEIERMHKVYGPVVRVRPDLVHINDPEFIDEVFAGPSRHRDKSEFFCNGFAGFKNNVALGCQGRDLHRARRAPLNAFFSKASIRRIEPILHDAMAKVFAVFDRHAVSGEPITVELFFMALTNDIITAHAFGESWNSLEHRDLNKDFFREFRTLGDTWHLYCYHPWVFRMMLLLPRWVTLSLPDSITSALMPQGKSLLPYWDKLRRQIESIRTSDKNDGSQSIIRELLDGKLPESVQTTQHIMIESRQLMAAGTDTSAHAMTAITYHLLANPDKLQKLKVELAVAMPKIDDIPTCAQLEGLPYLTAVIHEALRLDAPVVMIMERIAPEEELHYHSKRDGKRYIIPRGTTMGMCIPIPNRDETLFDAPFEFRPERFIENPALAKWQMPFGKGTRRCLGENLAISELYIATAMLFRKYDVYKGSSIGARAGVEGQEGPTLELYRTEREDIAMAYSQVIPSIEKGREGVRIRVHH